MISAFGVDHLDTVSKRATVPDPLTPLLPGNSVKAYDKSKRHKTKAAALTAGAKLGGAVVGGGLGILAFNRLARAGRVKKLVTEPTKIKGTKHELTGEMKRGWGQSTAAGAGGAVVGGVAGNTAFKHVKRNRKEYGYRASR